MLFEIKIGKGDKTVSMYDVQECGTGHTFVVHEPKIKEAVTEIAKVRVAEYLKKFESENIPVSAVKVTVFDENQNSEVYRYDEERVC